MTTTRNDDILTPERAVDQFRQPLLGFCNAV
jgi:hypothetical protein